MDQSFTKSHLIPSVSKDGAFSKSKAFLKSPCQTYAENLKKLVHELSYNMKTLPNIQGFQTQGVGTDQMIKSMNQPGHVLSIE